jgi:hypothetical protein
LGVIGKIGTFRKPIRNEMKAHMRVKLVLAALGILVEYGVVAQPFIPRRPSEVTYSSQWTYYANRGQVYRANGSAATDVLYHTVGTNPALHVQRDGKVAIVNRQVSENDPTQGTLAEVNMTFVGEGVLEPRTYLIDPTLGVRNFYERFTPEGVTGVTGGKRVVLENVYNNIDFHITSNNAGPEFHRGSPGG